MIVVKTYLLTSNNAVSEIRRLVFQDSPSLSRLVEEIRSIYSIPDSQQVRLQWLDSDGDRVMFSTDSELVDALSWTRASGQEALKVFIGQPSAPSEVEHPNVLCDGCERPVRGYRFKCVICNDFDLCSSSSSSSGSSSSSSNTPPPWPLFVEKLFLKVQSAASDEG